MTPAAMSLKAVLRNAAARTGVPAQLLLQDFFLERFLARLSASDARPRFIVKGGVLLMGLLGVARRTTMDIDATLRGIPLSAESAETLVRRVCAVDVGDGISFAVASSAPIRKGDRYGGFRVKVNARFESITGQVTIDATAGDAIAGGPVEHDLPSQFDAGLSFRVFGYPVETVLAEKVESVLMLGEFGTRPRDYYDIHMILGHLPFSAERFAEAFRATVSHRGSEALLRDDLAERIDVLARSDALLGEWEKYRRRFRYAEQLSFSDVVTSLRTIANYLPRL